MYEDFEKLYPIDASMLDPKQEVTMGTSPYACFIPGARYYLGGLFPHLNPQYYTNWRDESLAWHLTCSFHTGLNPTPAVILRGPDAKKFLKENFVNNIENFPIGIIKHGIMCVDNGMMATHGVIMHIDEDTYELHWHMPFAEYAFSLNKYDAEIIDITQQFYLFQLFGPRSLEIIEQVTKDDLHELQYRNFCDSSIDGHKVRILRFGMSGGLGYEIHGDITHAREVHKKLVEIGSPYGIRLMGSTTYAMNHTPGGFVQMGVNMLSACSLQPGFMEFLQGFKGHYGYAGIGFIADVHGSASKDPMNMIFNPIEVGLGHCINWNHEFRGKAALQEYAKTAQRNIVSLEWNPEDLAEVYQSQFRPGVEPYEPMELPSPQYAWDGKMHFSVDWVLDKNGKEIGRAIGRTQSHYHRAMLSLASLDKEYRSLGNEVFVLWGDPGKPQMKIRATVAPFPYNTNYDNATYDVSNIQRPKF